MLARVIPSYAETKEWGMFWLYPGWHMLVWRASQRDRKRRAAGLMPQNHIHAANHPMPVFDIDDNDLDSWDDFSWLDESPQLELSDIE
jgi:hypothetical protein